MTISAADFRDIEIAERDVWLDLYAALHPMPQLTSTWDTP
jgi:hypothetical protein